MPFKLHFVMLAAACLALIPGAPVTRAADGADVQSVPAPAEMSPGDWEEVKTLLKATNEEWSVIYPQLGRIYALREDVYATAEKARPARQSAFDKPMGGTSLNAPEMPNRGGGRQSGESWPFDPKNAPGVTSQRSALAGVFRGLLLRTLIDLLLPDQGHPVQTVLAELKTLADSPGATDDQIREKLATVRAVRNKALRDLEAAQKELAPYLTIDQTAQLVSLGILN